METPSINNQEKFTFKHFMWVQGIKQGKFTFEHFMWLHPSFFWMGDLQLGHPLEFVMSQRQFAAISDSSSVPLTAELNNNAINIMVPPQGILADFTAAV